MKKILLGVLIVIALAGTATFVYCGEIAVMLAFNKLKPARPFSSASTPASPDYSRRDSWTALPDRKDSADALDAIGVIDQQARAAVDVFFVHPTTYYGPTTGIRRSITNRSTSWPICS